MTWRLRYTIRIGWSRFPSGYVQVTRRHDDVIELREVWCHLVYHYVRIAYDQT
jgi:hypothetical protein